MDQEPDNASTISMNPDVVVALDPPQPTEHQSAEQHYTEETFHKLSTKEKVALILSTEDANRDTRMALAIMVYNIMMVVPAAASLRRDI